MDFKANLAEALGTFGLVFCGTGAIIINDLSGGTVTHVGISITFGLIVMSMIYAFGDISGAHINPAVTIGFWVADRFPLSRVLHYIISQCVGAFIASGLLKLLFPDHPTLGATLPSGPIWQSLLLETILTFLLMLVIIQVATGSKEKGTQAGIAIGGMVMLAAMFAGPVTGASMNPARSLAPALVSGQLEHLWLYLVAPVAGSILAILTWKALH